MCIPIVCSVPVYELDSLSKMSKLRPATAAGKASLSYRHPLYRGGGGLADFESSTVFNKNRRMSGVQKYLLVECDGSMLFINNQPGCCLISIYVLVPAAWISLMSSMAG